MFDVPLPTQGYEAYVGTYHINGVDGWTGPTDFYRFDLRAPVAPNRGKTWAPIYFWADPTWTEPEMFILFEPLEFAPPPADRFYTLKLLRVPDGVVGAPPVGTTWTIPHDQTSTLFVPTYPSEEALAGYQFEFAISAEQRCLPTPIGDSNCDGAVSFSDINFFVNAILGESVWNAGHGGAPPCAYVCANDINQDGRVDFADINPFVRVLTQS